MSNGQMLMITKKWSTLKKLIFSKVSGGHTGRLPKEYQEVTYLELPSPTNPDPGRMTKAYMLSGISGNNKTIEIKYERVAEVQNGPIIINSYTQGGTGTPVGPWAATNGRTNGTGTTITPTGSEINTPTVYSVYFADTTNYVRIGGWSDKAWTAVGRYYFCKIYDDNRLVFDGVPCYRKNDGKTGMFDIVGNEFCPCSGEAEFETGPIV